VEFYHLHADIASEIMTRHLLRPVHPDGLVVFRVFAVGETEVVAEKPLQEFGATIDNSLL
jgi:hypothetical protein